MTVSDLKKRYLNLRGQTVTLGGKRFKVTDGFMADKLGVSINYMPRYLVTLRKKADEVEKFKGMLDVLENNLDD